MKKLLALVLALVMTLGLATVGANAAFSDADSINTDYTEAVEVMNAIKVLEGSNGAFNPTQPLTREQGAKIITYMLLGKTAGDALTAPAAPFDDVAADRWSAGSIAYAVSQGIIGGVGNNKFNPEAPLTNAAFAKMLLCALGYDADIEGLGGPDWTLNTASLVNKISLADGLGGVSYNATITREQAAQFAYNTLMATLVYYNVESSVGTNGSSINTTLRPIQSQEVDTIGSAANTTPNYRIDDATAYTQFCEKYFPKLKLDAAGNDTFDRVSDVWRLAGVKIGTYAKEASIVYTDNMNTAAGRKQIKADLENYNNYGPANTLAATSIWINGVNPTGAATLDNADAAGNLPRLTGNGRRVEIFTSNNAINRIVIVDTVLGKVKSVNSDGTLTITGIANAGTGLTAADQPNTEKGYNSFKKDDLVLLTMTTTTAAALPGTNLGTPANNTIQSVEAPVVVTGIASTRNSADATITLAGTTYKAAFAVTSDGTHDVAGFGVSSQYDATLYLDTNNYILYTKAGAAAVSDHAIAVTKSYSGLNKDGIIVPMIQGVTSDGQTVTWEYESVGGTATVLSTATAVAAANTMYTYADADSDNAYELTTAVLGDISATAATNATNGLRGIHLYTTTGTKSLSASNAQTTHTGTTGVAGIAYFDSNTKFVFVNNGKATVLDSVPKIGSSTEYHNAYVAMKNSSGTTYATAVYIIGETAPASATSTGEVVFVGAATGTTQVTDASTGNAVTRTTYTAYIDGEKVSNFYAAANSAPGFYYVKIDNDTGEYLLAGNEYTATTGATAVVAGANTNGATAAYAGTTLTTDAGDFDLADAKIIDLITNVSGTGTAYDSVEELGQTTAPVTAANNRYLFVMYDNNSRAASYVYAVGGLYTTTTTKNTAETATSTQSSSTATVTVTPDRWFAFLNQTVTYTVKFSGTTVAADQNDYMTITPNILTNSSALSTKSADGAITTTTVAANGAFVLTINTATPSNLTGVYTYTNTATNNLSATTAWTQAA